MPARRTLSLLDVDPDLGALVPADRLEAARHELDVEVHRLDQGPWNAGGDHANPEHVGLLLLDGVISREVVVSDTVSTELLGPGDVVRPWSLQEPAGLLQLTIRWNALTESRVAVLDRRFGAQLVRWPEVNAALIDRVNDRAQRLAVTQAISQLNRVDRRLQSLFWHLAERWGRMTPGGVVVPLALTHETIGRLAGAERPTVTLALGELARTGVVTRREDGSFVLREGSAEALAAPRKAMHVHRGLAAARTAPPPPAHAGEAQRSRLVDTVALQARVAALHADFPERARSIEETLATSAVVRAHSVATRERLSSRRRG